VNSRNTQRPHRSHPANRYVPFRCGFFPCACPCFGPSTGERDAHQFLFFPTSHENLERGRGPWRSGTAFSSPLAGKCKVRRHGVAPGYPWLIAMGLKLSNNDGYGRDGLCSLSELPHLCPHVAWAYLWNRGKKDREP